MSPLHIRFGTEIFTAASGAVEGVPDHATMIEGRLIHLDTKNLRGWGVTAAASKQIIDGINGIPIKACNALNPLADPHACDFDSDNSANVGYVTGARIEDGWVVASAAITDRIAAQKINDGTWMPFGEGGWSVTGFPTAPAHNFEIETSGLTNGFAPSSIALIIGNGRPAFEGSGFDMVVAAIQNYDHRGDDMDKTDKDGGGDPATYTQDALDKAIVEALEKQKTDTAAAVTEALEKQKAEFDVAGNKHTTEELARQKLEYDEQVKKLSIDDKAAYDAKLAEMTPTVDVEKMIAAAVTQGQTDTIEAIERNKLATEYNELLTASIIGAPYMVDGELVPEMVDAKMVEVREMTSAAIGSMISDAKMLVAAIPTPPGSAFDEMPIPGQAAGTTGALEAEELDAAMVKLGGKYLGGA